MAEGFYDVSRTYTITEGWRPEPTWVLPHRIDSVTFIGKDILVVGYDIYIAFFHLKKNSELVYVANSEEGGDGVDVVAGHKTYMFAFAEKTKNSRIFVVTYPQFNIMAEMRDTEVNRYKGLSIMECDLVAAISGFPNYLISVWSWRSGQRLISIPTGVIRRTQMFMASRTHMLVCQCWGEGLIVWEVAQCFRRCFMMRRAKEEVTGWTVADPPYVAIAWSNDGQLYAIDENAGLYCLLSDGIGMTGNLEWSENLTGPYKPAMCSYGHGLLIYGPDNNLRALKKADNKWKVVWEFTPFEEVCRLVSNFTNDAAAMWTVTGLIYRLTGDSEEKIEVTPLIYKQRHIKSIQMIAPDFYFLATINYTGMLCIYEIGSGKLSTMIKMDATDVLMEASPCDPILCITGLVAKNYGLALYEVVKHEDEEGELSVELIRVTNYCLTHQIVDKIVFSLDGRYLKVAAMSAGHIFIFTLSEDYTLDLVRYSEIGRGLADCFLMNVGDAMRSFSLVIFSDKYLMGERIVCINAVTGKDNKFAGKMAGPYSRLLPHITKDTMIAIPHMQRVFHVLKLTGEKGVTVFVKMGPIIYAGHNVKCIDGVYFAHAFLTFGFDGKVILRLPEAPEDYEVSVDVSHRYAGGVRQCVVDAERYALASRAAEGATLAGLVGRTRVPYRPTLDPKLLVPGLTPLGIISVTDKNYLEIIEDRKVREEAMDYKPQRDEVVRGFQTARAQLVALLEENIAERPLHQLSLSEFNLHMEHKRERYRMADRQREEVRLGLEARIRAQDKVTLWIRTNCWDTMLTQRVKLYAIFSHYQVENYCVLPTQRDKWPELALVEALRGVEMENDRDLFCPWEEPEAEPEATAAAAAASRIEQEPVGEPSHMSVTSGILGAVPEASSELRQPYALAASSTHRVITPLPYYIPQTRAYSFLHMNWMHHIVKLTVQNLRIWFNKQFDDLMGVKKREVGLVEERNARLRFIIEELNKLSDLRGSFHHLTMRITDPEWRQEEQPQKLIKVEPEECSIEPYISPSQIVIIPPDPGPKDDFRERALIEMMDGVLEKLWHEEIKKPVPMPQCMLDKDPENFNEDDLRFVFDYEAKVAFRNEERDKYRKMLHAEYAKLSQVLNEGIVKFNMRVKELWLTKLKIDSTIGQENLSLMRLRRTNLDRVETAEKIEELRGEISRYTEELETLTEQSSLIMIECNEVQLAYDALQVKDKQMEKAFKNHFADLSSIIVDQCYKFYKKRPKWQQRASMIPVILYEMASGMVAGVRPTTLHPDCIDYFKGVEQLDLISNMPPVMDEGLWTTMVKLRRVKIENEIRMRGVAQEMAYVESAMTVWTRAQAARRTMLHNTHARIAQLREEEENTARNKTVQLVLPAGQVEIFTTGHMEDYDDATLIPREDIEKINNLILRVGELKLRMMRKQMEFRKTILAKEWEHAQMKMKLRHMDQELYSYRRLKIPKELQYYLKNKELGYTDEMDYMRMEKEMQATKFSVNKELKDQIQKVEDLQMKVNSVEAQATKLETLIGDLNVMVSEKKLNEDPLEPIRIRKILKKRMENLVMRGNLIREVQQNHTTIVLLQTELELLRLRTFPTLASFKTFN